MDGLVRVTSPSVQDLLEDGFPQATHYAAPNGRTKHLSQSEEENESTGLLKDIPPDTFSVTST